MNVDGIEKSRIFINSIINLLEEYIRQPVTIINLINKTGYSRWYVQRKFSSLTGISMKSYIRSRKMTEVAKIILSTDKKIVDIAVEYGYLDQQSLCRAFKNYYGISPVRFRKENKFREDIWISADTIIIKDKLTEIKF
ncbi:helix-turn-helix domain-containing protein [Providencia rettgeri]|jgi:AraC family transcriptional activator of mar-sox-rob regulon|nr:helix-turn-helix domain-containing protein [Providencia rettgeri]